MTVNFADIQWDSWILAPSSYEVREDCICMQDIDIITDKTTRKQILEFLSYNQEHTFLKPTPFHYQLARKVL